MNYLEGGEPGDVGDSERTEATGSVGLRGSAGTSEPHGIVIKEKFSWVVSASFWMHWKTRGHMDACEHSEVICINGRAAFPAIMGSNARAAALLVSYRRTYKELLVAMTEFARKMVNDIDAVDHAAVVLGLPKRIRTMMFQPLLESIRQKNWLRWGSRKSIKELESELDQCKCALVAAKDGSPVRVVTIIALQMTRPSGEVLLQVAEVNGDDCTFSARPPGTKLRENEVPTVAAMRVLGDVTKDADVEGFGLGELHSVTKGLSDSPTYGLQTEYRRNICATSYQGAACEEAPRLSAEELQHNAQCVTSTPKQQLFSQTGRSSLTSVVGDEVVNMIRHHVPHFSNHYPHHIHAIPDNGKTTIYAWVHPEDVELLKEFVNKRS